MGLYRLLPFREPAFYFQINILNRKYKETDVEIAEIKSNQNGG